MNKDTIQIWCACVGCLFFLAWGIIRYNKGTYEKGEKVHKNLGFAIGTFRESITGGMRTKTESLYFDFNTNGGAVQKCKI